MSAYESSSFEDAGSSDDYVPSHNSSENESDAAVPERQVRKKRKLPNIEKWKRNVRKNNRALGKAYVGATGKRVGDRKIGNDCECKYGCFTKVSVNNRNTILENFNKLGTKARQDEYLSGLITCQATQRRKHNAVRNRLMANTYHVS